MIWSVSDVKDTETYRLHLCEQADGTRFFRLVAIGSEADKHPATDVVLVSGPVPHELLRKRNVIRIAESVALESGEKFYVDAHGVWLGATEVAAMDAGLDFAQVPWLKKRVPKFPPR
jgi:hypothetical protein